MNQKNKITYEQLLALSIEEFNIRQDKTIQELLLYLYHHNNNDGIEGFTVKAKEIYKTFVDIDEIFISILCAINELINETDCADCAKSLSDFADEFQQIYLEFEKKNPIYFFGDSNATINTFIENLSFFFGAFNVLEDWGYDMSKLMIPR